MVKYFIRKTLVMNIITLEGVAILLNSSAALDDV